MQVRGGCAVDPIRSLASIVTVISRATSLGQVCLVIDLTVLARDFWRGLDGFGYWRRVTKRSEDAWGFT